MRQDPGRMGVDHPKLVRFQRGLLFSDVVLLSFLFFPSKELFMMTLKRVLVAASCVAMITGLGFAPAAFSPAPPPIPVPDDANIYDWNWEYGTAVGGKIPSQETWFRCDTDNSGVGKRLRVKETNVPSQGHTTLSMNTAGQEVKVQRNHDLPTTIDWEFAVQTETFGLGWSDSMTPKNGGAGVPTTEYAAIVGPTTLQVHWKPGPDTLYRTGDDVFEFDFAMDAYASGAYTLSMYYLKEGEDGFDDSEEIDLTEWQNCTSWQHNFPYRMNLEGQNREAGPDVPEIEEASWPGSYIATPIMLFRFHIPVGDKYFTEAEPGG